MSAIKFWTVFAVGVTAGAAVALMYAPQTGVKTRRQLRKGIDDATDYIKDRSEEFGDYADKAYKRGRDVVDDLVSSAGKVSKRVADLV